MKLVKDIIRELPYVITISYISTSTLIVTAKIIEKIFG